MNNETRWSLKIILISLQFTARYTVKVEPSNLGYDDLCVRVVRSVFNRTTDSIQLIRDIPVNGGCPAVNGAYNDSLLTEGQECSPGVNYRLSGGTRVCCKYT